MRIVINNIIGILLFTASSICIADITASFKQHHYPLNQKIKLVDLIYLRGNSQEKNRINNIIIDTRKHPTEITRANIVSYLDGYSIRWKGKEIISPSSINKTPIEKSDLVSKAKACLGAQLSELKYEHTLKLLDSNSSSKTHVSSANYRLKCKFLKQPKTRNVAKTIPVKVLVLQNERVTSSKTFWFGVTINLPIFIATKEIKAGDPISANAYVRKNKSFAGINENYIDSNDRIVLEGYIASKDIKQNSPLTHKNLIIKPDVANNEIAILNYHKGNFSIRMKVRAREHGYINDLVEVLVPSSKELLIAKVTGIGELTINEN